MAVTSGSSRHDHELKILVAHPHFQKTLQAFKDDPSDPVTRVRKAVHTAAIHPKVHELLGWHPHEVDQRARDLADTAGQHARMALDQHKQSKASVQYTDDHGKSNEQCSKCSHYVNPTTCNIVAGAIRPEGWCNAFAPNDGDADAAGADGAAAAVGAAPSAGDTANLRTVVFIRHGATHLNNNDTSVDRVRGWKDVPLSDEGRAQAHKVGATIAKQPPDVIVSSDLNRASETAHIVSQKSGAPIGYVGHDFRPWNVGQMAGQVSKKAIPVLSKYAEQEPDKALPQGESFNCFKFRFFRGVAAALQAFPDQQVAIITHHRGERLMQAWKAAGYPADGSIDIKTFNSKGEPTGHAERMQIPVDRVRAVAAQTPPCGYEAKPQPVHAWKEDDSNGKTIDQRRP